MALRRYQGTDVSRLSASHSDIKCLVTAFHVHQNAFKCIQVNMKNKTQIGWKAGFKTPNLACFKAETNPFKLTLVYRFCEGHAGALIHRQYRDWVWQSARRDWTPSWLKFSRARCDVWSTLFWFAQVRADESRSRHRAVKLPPGPYPARCATFSLLAASAGMTRRCWKSADSASFSTVKQQDSRSLLPRNRI